MRCICSHLIFLNFEHGGLLVVGWKMAKSLQSYAYLLFRAIAARIDIDCLSLALISVVSNYSYNYPQLHLIMTHYKSFSFSKMNQLRHLVACSIWHRRLTLLNGKLSGNVNSLHALALFWTTFFLCMLRASYMSCGIWLFLWINPKNNQRDLVDYHGKHGPTVKMYSITMK